ncbi:DUF1499 domain-containing protein [Paralimibaculum aggregatum]|uniref:DUF1499 domain-containing protein n=1 Tax=Paralimibaculum aggregatum TaxID=3036245 RepID=A0ABQ6LQ79_9RHOB|nr:DUF1499 domain-containing protein [Limibaculum sp. NKW23]GMG84866.1 DUF1499 domain-containing protein [Limibaculum sp. NKW23]
MGRLFHDKWPWRRDAEGRTALEVIPARLRWALGLALILFAGAGMAIWSVDHDPARWHADPLASERTGRPNDHLVAPEGLAAAPVDAVFAPVFPPAAESPAALIAQLHRVAMAEPRVTVVAGSPEALHVTYVQRSAVFGFPDYISVRAVPVGGGAGLALWSRARFGYSDMGVNAARVSRWLGALGVRGAN